MTSELIEAAAKAIKGSVAYSSFWPNSDYEIMARAAISVIAPAVLEEAAGAAMRAVLAASLSKAVWDDVSALKTRYEQ